MTTLHTNPRSDRWWASIPTGAWWVVNLCLAVLFLYPLYVLVTQATKNNTEASAAPPTLIPHSFTFDNFAQLGTSYGGVTLLQSLENSVVVSVLSSVITLVVSSLAGYSIA
jgi:multiple sugar transport system permease protein